MKKTGFLVILMIFALQAMAQLKLADSLSFDIKSTDVKKISFVNNKYIIHTHHNYYEYDEKGNILFDLRSFLKENEITPKNVDDIIENRNYYFFGIFSSGDFKIWVFEDNIWLLYKKSWRYEVVQKLSVSKECGPYLKHASLHNNKLYLSEALNSVSLLYAYTLDTSLKKLVPKGSYMHLFKDLKYERQYVEPLCHLVTNTENTISFSHFWMGKGVVFDTRTDTFKQFSWDDKDKDTLTTELWKTESNALIEAKHQFFGSAHTDSSARIAVCVTDEKCANIDEFLNSFEYKFYVSNYHPSTNGHWFVDKYKATKIQVYNFSTNSVKEYTWAKNNRLIAYANGYLYVNNENTLCGNVKIYRYSLTD